MDNHGNVFVIFFMVAFQVPDFVKSKRSFENKTQMFTSKVFTHAQQNKFPAV